MPQKQRLWHLMPLKSQEESIPSLQLTRARSAQQVRAERHFVPHRAFIIYGPSQLNAVLDRRVSR